MRNESAHPAKLHDANVSGPNQAGSLDCLLRRIDPVLLVVMTGANVLCSLCPACDAEFVTSIWVGIGF